METYIFEKSTVDDVYDLLKEHASTLSSPWDSYMEDNLFDNSIYKITMDNCMVGYASINNSYLFSFFIKKTHYRYASDILTALIEEKEISQVQVLTNDPLLSGLIIDWNYEVISIGACFFTDGQKQKQVDSTIPFAKPKQAI